MICQIATSLVKPVRDHYQLTALLALWWTSTSPRMGCVRTNAIPSSISLLWIYVLVGLNLILDCHSNCIKCNGGSYDTCTECKPGFFYTEALTLCSASCPLGYYADGTNCQPCMAQCESCSSASECSTCPLSKLSQNKDCVDSCGDGFHQGGSLCLGQ